MARSRVAVIGAGMAGMSASRDLARAGNEVVVFDKARGVGGRMPTRRHEAGAFDHGAQYFTARSEVFRGQVEDWCKRGLAAIWDATIVRLDKGQITAENDPSPRYVGVPKMSVLARDLGEGLEIRCGAHVAGIERLDSGWSLTTREQGVFGGFDAVVLATPAPQTIPLLPRVGSLGSARERIERVEVDPCQAVMASFCDALPVDFDAAFVAHSPLAWIARNGSKPGRPPGECWVLHASPEWSQEHVDLAPEAVARELIAALEEVLGGGLLAADQVVAHRWLYAKTRRPEGDACLWSAESGVGICGDWMIGSRVEDAFLSGHALAREMQRPAFAHPADV